MTAQRESTQHLLGPAPFVTSDFARCSDALLVAPTPAITAEPPLQMEPSAFFDRAHEQHVVMQRRLQERGVATHVVAGGVSGVAPSVADLAVVISAGAILMRPSNLSRRADVVAVEAILKERGIPVLGAIEPPGLLDGADVIYAGDALYVGVPYGEGRYARRGNELGRQRLAQLSGLPVIEVPVRAHVPRLRAVATLVDAKTVVLGGAAVDVAPFDGFERIVLPLGEEYAASLMVLAPRTVIANLRFRESPKLLKKARIRMEAIDLWEMGKAGMLPSALMLPLVRR